MSFFGTVEKYFAYIINPKEHNPSFWILVNYYWSAYFAILKPLLKHYYGDEWGQEEYGGVLKDLNETNKKVEKFIKEFKGGNEEYYTYIKELFVKSDNFKVEIMTTNYTQLSKKCGENPIYLSGKLTQFEYPHLLQLKDIDAGEEKIHEEDFVFPFLMTQAPIKPIIFPEQIEEYAKANEALREADILIILGYSIGQADNHINAMIRKFYFEGKHIIYMNYNSNNSEELDVDNKKKDIFGKLRIFSNDCDNKRLHIVSHGENEKGEGQ